MRKTFRNLWKGFGTKSLQKDFGAKPLYNKRALGEKIVVENLCVKHSEQETIEKFLLCF